MTITLSAEQEQLLLQAMEAGGYETAADVIVRALEVLRAEDGHLHESQGLIAAKIDPWGSLIEEISLPRRSRERTWRSARLLGFATCGGSGVDLRDMR